MADGFQRGAFEGLLDTVGRLRKARQLRAHAQHLVAEAMPAAQQQHGLLLQFVGIDFPGMLQMVAARHRHDEGLVIQRLHGQPGIGKGLGHDGAVDLALLEQLDQLDRVVLLQHQRHLRHGLDHLLDQRGQQVGPDGVDHAKPQRPGQRVLALLGDFADGHGLLQHALGLRHDLLADRRHRDFGRAALEDLHIEFVFQLLDRHRQRRLRHEAGFGRPAEMALARHGDDVLEFGESHSFRQLCAGRRDQTTRPSIGHATDCA